MDKHGRKNGTSGKMTMAMDIKMMFMDGILSIMARLLSCSHGTHVAERLRP
ncbi:MAG: hypothetical protein ACLTXP_12980 [Odoribacter splanchnicus]